MSYRDRGSSGTGLGFWITVVVVLAAALVLILIVFAFLKRVDPGNVGVLVDYGAGTTADKPVITPVLPGQWEVVWPLQYLAEYPAAQQSLTMVRREEEGGTRGDDSVDCKDKTGIQVNVDLTVLWRVQPERIGDLFLLYPRRDISQIKDELVRRLAREALADACGQFGFLEIAGTKRIEFGIKVGDLLGPRLERTYLLMTDISIGEVYLQPEQQKAITDKSVAEQQALRAQYQLQQNQYLAQAAIAEAEGQKQVKILQAQGQAEAIRIINEQLGQSTYYIEYVYASEWDGVLPSTLVLADGQTFPLLGAINLAGSGIDTTAQPPPTATPATAEATPAPTAAP